MKKAESKLDSYRGFLRSFELEPESHRRSWKNFKQERDTVLFSEVIPDGHRIEELKAGGTDCAAISGWPVVEAWMKKRRFKIWFGSGINSRK